MTRWEVIPMISREEALELLKKYNKEEFHGSSRNYAGMRDEVHGK